MRTSIMASTIILCFMLTILSILTINSISATKVAEQTSLNNIVDSSLNAMELDKKYNQENYEEIVNDLLQLILLQSNSDGNVNVKILEANTQEGLLDVEVTKTYVWFGIKKQVTARRTVILDEFENPPVDPVSVIFIYNDGYNDIIWREDSTFVGAILKRPKNPKRPNFTFEGWSKTVGGVVISDDDWQNYIVPDDILGEPKVLTLYAIFKPTT